MEVIILIVGVVGFLSVGYVGIWIAHALEDIAKELKAIRTSPWFKNMLKTMSEEEPDGTSLPMDK